MSLDELLSDYNVIDGTIKQCMSPPKHLLHIRAKLADIMYAIICTQNGEAYDKQTN